MQARLVRASWPEVLTALASALPALAVGGNRLNADTKLYLTSDPVGLMSRATQAWDATQFGGYVPHQAVAYLWPSGPYHWLARLTGLPPWFAQRLFVALLFAVAGIGVARFLRAIGVGSLARLVGGLAYASTPYVLPYQSRTSSMLLSWTVLGWACLCATRGRSDPSWRWPAALALLLGTAGAVNGAAIALVLPAVVLSSLVAVNDRAPRWRSGLVVLLRGSLLTVGTSLWWVAAVAIQARHGADVLAFSETVEDVSSTSNAFEVLRGFGYWLNYVGLDGIPATTATQAVIASRLALAATLVVPIVGLCGLLLARTRPARLGAGLVAVGAVLAIGVYPLSASPLYAMPLAHNPESWLSLAVRSSTRALPVMVLGLAVGVALALDTITVWSRRAPSRPAARWMPGVLAAFVICGSFAATPARWRDGLVDPALSRPGSAPPSWPQLIAAAEAASDPSTRLLQLPGQEFGAHTWGYTLDPVLPSLTSRQVLTRDLLPLGSAQSMDLLWALDDAGREGSLSPESLEELTRILAVGAVVVPGDLDVSRYPAPSQPDYLASNGLDTIATVVGPHVYLDPETPTSILRQQVGSVVLAGSGAGLVNAAGRDLLGTGTVRYVSDLTDEELAGTLAEAAGLVVTDTNTESSRHWRGTRDTLGFPESADGTTAISPPLPGDRRLQPFLAPRPTDRTWFEQEGDVVATATDYGEAVRLLPEFRPYRAVDGDERTAWLTDRRGDARGEILALSFSQDASAITLLQPGWPANRRITQVSISVDGGPWRQQALGEGSTVAPGDRVDLERPGRSVSIRIDETRPIPDTDRQRGVDPVGFTEVRSTQAGTGTKEIGVLPARALAAVSADTPVTFVVSRLRSPGWDPERGEPELGMLRRFTIRHPMEVRARVRVGHTDDKSAPVVLLNDAPVDLVPGDSPDEWRSAAPLRLDQGRLYLDTTASPVLVDSVELRDVRWNTPQVPIRTETITGTGSARRTAIGACAGPCWLVFGEGFNAAWRARLNGDDLGPPQIVDGGWNGWFFPGGHDGGRLDLVFLPQRWLTLALWLSGVFGTVCLWVLRPRRRTNTCHAISRDSHAPVGTRRLSAAAVGLLCVAGSALALPFPVGVGVGIAVAVVLRCTGADVLARSGAAVVSASLLWGWWILVRDRPVARFTWPEATEHLHIPLLVGLACLVTGILSRPVETARTASVDSDVDQFPS